MPGRFEYKTLAKYPHMKPEDVAVWERFITKNPAFFERVDYDVVVGAGAPQNADHSENIQKMGTILTQKKIDVVGYNGELASIVEVGPIADMRKLGQILTYATLFAATYPDVRIAQKIVLCGQVERELEPMFAEHDIVIELA